MGRAPVNAARTELKENRINPYEYNDQRPDPSFLRYGSAERKGSSSSGKDLTLAIDDTYSVRMCGIRFEWDKRKARENVRKHKVSFEEAQTVFLDENAIRFFDPDHSKDEDRFLMLGMSFTLRVLVVCHCHREEDSVIRIISARKADKREQADYWS